MVRMRIPSVPFLLFSFFFQSRGPIKDEKERKTQGENRLGSKLAECLDNPNQTPWYFLST